MGLFDDNPIVFNCPKCNASISQTIGRLKAHNNLTCPGCGTRIELDTRELFAGTDEAEKAINSLPKRIDIRF
jgi:transcription elongation factor Elf1